MVLRRLELQGYKTFAIRTEFQFNSGITAIVGPNGSGKSNIADAIRWVLGEQRQTNLRIKRTEDLIFAGSRQRPQQGMAEVSITLDNTGHWLPLEFEEVMITRRVYRSGESDYLVNGARMRARDVIEMLEKGGLSRDTYIVIGQGLVDAALSLRPAERRSLFEAAAGIRIYQAKKEEALAKLEETRVNLVRINDILNEIAPRLATLQAQAQRAAEHELLSRDLQELLRLWYGHHWQRQWEALQGAEARQAELTEFISHQQASIRELTQRLAELVAQQARLRQSLSAWHRESGVLHTQVEEKDRHLAVSQERLRLLHPQKADLERETAALQLQCAEALLQIEAIEKEWQQLEGEREQTAASLRQARVLWEQERKKQEGLEHELQKVREGLLRATAAIADYDDRLAELAEQRTASDTECQEQREAIARRETALSDLAESLRAHVERANALQQEVSDRETEMARLREETAASQARWESLNKQAGKLQGEIAALCTRQQMLQRMRQELSGYYAGVRTVLQAAERGDLSGILGPVVRLLRISPELDAAIEVALGSHLQDIVVERWADAEAAITLLKRVGGGRATFLPLDTVRSPQAPAVPKRGRVLGLASELVQFDPRYKPAIEMLLGQTLVVTDLKVARRLLAEMVNLSESSKLSERWRRVVTLEGELVLANGSVSGGSRQATDSRIALERDWREIPGHLAVLEAKQEELDGQKREEEHVHQKLAGQLQGLSETVTGLRKALELARREETRLERQRDRLQEESSWYTAALQRAEKELSTLDNRRDELQKQRQAAQKQRAALAEALASLQSQWDALQGDKLQGQVAAAETSLAIAMRNQENQQKLLHSQRLTLQRLEEQIAAKKARVSELEADIAEAGARIQSLQGETLALRGRLEELRKAIEPAEEEIAALDKQERKIQEEMTRARARLSELETRAHQVALERKLAQDELGRLQRQIEEDLGPVILPQRYPRQLRLSLGQAEIQLAEVTVLPEGLESEIKELKARLRRVGAFNPNAPAEYQEALARHTFLTNQAADLERAIQSLHGVIAELDEVMEREFSHTFTAVAEAFTAYFTLLFGGGTAKLALTEPDESGQRGVEIIARPPAKRLQSLALLSGGERALTAAALLFAILKTRPLPFCVLDEVDAMLDEVNVGRFRDALQEMAQRTQFIVITHNRYTINAANTIYGISMRQDGVSVALSLQLDEAEREIVVNG